MGAILAITSTLILAYLIISKAPDFAKVVAAAGQAYVNIVSVLQGRS